MFSQFYKDIEKLHELVAPFRYMNELRKLDELFEAFKIELGKALFPVLQKEEDRMENEILNGTGENQPLGVIKA